MEQPRRKKISLLRTILVIVLAEYLFLSFGYLMSTAVHAADPVTRASVIVLIAVFVGLLTIIIENMVTRSSRKDED